MKKEATIMVVDDEENMRESLKDIFEEEGYKIILSDSGKDAIKKIEKYEINVVVSDVRMPEMDGFELLHEIKKIKPEIPFIMITAYSTTKLGVRAMKEGAKDYIEKPFDPDELLIIISKIIKQQAIINENIQLKVRLEKEFDIKNIIGKSDKIGEIIELIRKVAPAPSNVIIKHEVF